MSQVFRKLLISTVLAATVFTSLLLPFAKSAKAAAAEDTSTWYSQNFKDWAIKVFDSSNEDEIFGERYTAAQVQWILYSFIGHGINAFLGDELFTCLIEHDWSTDDCEEEIDNRFGRLVGAVVDTNTPTTASASFTKTVSDYVTYNSFSGVGYVVNTVRKLNPHLVPEVSAQGFGYGVFPSGNIFRRLWSTSRDISYFFVVLAVIYVSFLIMFRSKTSPQTAVTVQTALPKIVITLVLITFSYAIAGFLIDIMYLLIGLVATIVISSELITSSWSSVFAFLTTGPYNTGIFGFFFYYAIVFMLSAFSAVFQVMLSPNLPAFVFGLLSTILLPIVLLLLVFVYFIALFKTVFTIIKAYVAIVLNIIAAPFILAAGIIFPGVGLGSWLTSMMSNLLIFPVISVLAILSLVFALAAGGLVATIGTNVLSLLTRILGFLQAQNTDWVVTWNTDYFSGIDSVGWAPPLSVGSYGAVGSPDENHFVPLLMIVASISVLLLIPKAADLVKSLFARKPFAAGSAIGESLGPLAAGYAIGRGFAGDQIGAAGRAAYGAFGGPNWNQIANRLVNRYSSSGSSQANFSSKGSTKTNTNKPSA